MSNMIPLSGMDILEFVPPPFDSQELANPPTFFLRIPTFAIRDKIAAILFQRGLMPATVQVGRAILIDALFELYDEAQAEEQSAFLEDYWTKAEVHDELVRAWQMREAQRLFDVGMGVKKEIAPQEPIPPAPFTVRDQARQGRIVMDALDRHEGYRSFQARFMVAQEEEDELTMRLFIEGWRDCGDVAASRDTKDCLTLECVERVRRWLDDNGAPGAWQDVKLKVREQFGAPGKLEKNSDSPLDSNSSQSGSTLSSGDLGLNDGSSTTSSIERIPNSSLAETSGASRNSRSAKRTRSKAAPRKNGRTAART